MAVLTAGSKIGFGDGASTEVFNNIIGITTLSTPESTKSTIDTTTLTSTSKEYITGLADNGTLSLEGFWTESDPYHIELRDAYVAGGEHNFLITVVGGTAVEFAASIESFVINAEPDNAVTFSLGLKVSGEIDWDTSATVTG